MICNGDRLAYTRLRLGFASTHTHTGLHYGNHSQPLAGRICEMPLGWREKMEISFKSEITSCTKQNKSRTIRFNGRTYTNTWSMWDKNVQRFYSLPSASNPGVRTQQDRLLLVVQLVLCAQCTGCLAHWVSYGCGRALIHFEWLHSIILQW